ncbi:hypothetical protein CMI39_03130 [Candidatus Pacearchaeota archaeon]|jgi:hypothetical protein|nr:hypothetical protein [Candidatus Pacearchaeota archaeon]|tara:strand:+ start:20619 stop:20879 length:261 start_codon:yes stop_codon:yes gene_type:complete
MKTKPNGYWKDWSNVERELKPVIDKLGHFPTQKELIRLEKSSLINAIQKYHGGLFVIKERMDYEDNDSLNKQKLEKILSEYVKEEI